MSYSSADRYERERQLQQAGLNPERGSIRLHNSNETALHATVKTLLCREIQQRGRPWSTEVEFPNGSVCDVLDYGPIDGQAVVYEVESDPTRGTVRAKAEQYTEPFIVRDCLVLDLRDAPEEIEALGTWVGERVVG